MAFIKYKDHTHSTVSAEQGIAIWRVMNGEIPGTTAQRRFVRQVERIWLNRATAPRSYLNAYRDYRTSRISERQMVLPYKD